MNSFPLTDRWLDHFMEMCKLVSTMSKDPSTKVGSVIVRPNRTIVSTGYNGYPRGCNDDDYSNRERKYQRVVHAEMNALLMAKERLDGYTLFVWPLPPCDRCIPHIIQSGISTIVVPSISPEHHWSKPCVEAEMMAYETGLNVVAWDKQ